MTDSSLIASMPDIFLEMDNRGTVTRYLGGGSDDQIVKPEALEGNKIADHWGVSAAKLMLRNVRRALTDRRELRFSMSLTDADEAGRYEIRLLVRGFNRVLVILRRSDELDDALEADASDRQFVDTLTGLPRTSVFREQLEQMLADCRLRERGLAVVAMDIDDFDALNRSLGREIGDTVLRQSAQRIERYLRGSDSFTRLGNDAFVLIVADVDTREHADTIANRVDESFAEPLDICGQTIQVTPSSGIALFPVDGEDADTLLQNARVALNEARLSGKKSRQYYSNTMRFRSNRRLDDKAELRWAIERDQLALAYQPRVSLVTGRVDGLEALVRWNHPIRGQLLPQYFLPLADASGLMPEIGQWVIGQVLRDAASWNGAASELPISINLTESEFAHPSLVERTSQQLAAANIAPERLEFEVTERMLMSFDRAYIVTHKLNALGIGILVDQFGDGVSSAQKLVRFPVRAVKLSTELLGQVTLDPQQDAVCAALIAMSTELNWRVVAVGIESRAQLEFLRARGCAAIQGHFVAAAMANEVVCDYVAELKNNPLDANLIELDTVGSQVG